MPGTVGIKATGKGWWSEVDRALPAALEPFLPPKILHPITPCLPSPHCPSLRGHSSGQTPPATPAELWDAETGVGRFRRATTTPQPREVSQCSLLITSRPQIASCPCAALRRYTTCGQRVFPLQLLALFPQPPDLQVSFVEGMAENLARAFLQAADLQHTDSPAYASPGRFSP